MKIESAKRLANEGLGIFEVLNIWKAEAAERGHKIINLSIGAPDRPPPAVLRDALASAVQGENNYHYPFQEFALNEAIAAWFQKRFSVTLDPREEIMQVIGLQDALSHLPLALLNPGDTALVPDPGYPIYFYSVTLANGEIYRMPLIEENNYLPILADIPPEVAKAAKMIIVNYPSNPLAATAPDEFIIELIEFARKNEIIVCYDSAYAELYLNDKPIKSFLSFDGAKDVGVELHSFSKTYNIAGSRVAFAAGNREVLQALKEIKSNLDFGVFKPVQLMALEAVSNQQVQNFVASLRKLYAQRCSLMVNALKKQDWEIKCPEATFYLWAKIPPGYKSSQEFVRALVTKAGIIAIPGDAFGNNGEGYVRFSMVQEEDLLLEAAERIGRLINR